LQSDGSGGFQWGTGVTAGVSTVNGTPGAITINGTGDVYTALFAATSISITSGGTGYVLDRIYTTAPLVSTFPGNGISVRVTQIGGSGEIQAVSIYGAGQSWSVNDTINVLNTGKEGTSAVLEITSIAPLTNVGVSTWNGIDGRAAKILDIGGGPDRSETAWVPAFKEKNTLFASTIRIDVPTSSSTLYQKTTRLNSNSYTDQAYSGWGLDTGDQDIGIRGGITKNIRIGNYGGVFGNGSFEPTTEALAAFGNISIGQNTGIRLTTGQYNLAVGLDAGKKTTTGNYNTFIGPEAGCSNVAPGLNAREFSHSTFIGYRSGISAIASRDIGIGEYAGGGFNNDTNDQSAPQDKYRIAIGWGAYSGDLGLTQFPYQRFQFGSSQIGIGKYVATYNMSSSTTAVGHQIYIGCEAGKGQPVQTGDDNSYHIGIGSQALRNTTGKEGQIAIGRISANDSTTGDHTYGIAIGYKSGNYTGTSSGIGTINIGTESYASNFGGGGIAIGSSSFITGDNTIAIGKNAQAGAFNGSVNNSIAIGSGAENEFSGGVALGAGATTTDANQFAIGSTANAVGTVTVSNPSATTTTWTVKINGIDYKIPMYAA